MNKIIKDQFSNFIADKCSSHNESYKHLKLNINKILYVHTSSGYKYDNLTIDQVYKKSLLNLTY
jgi:hypothetical protein